MRELLIDLIPWGVDVIVAIQAASGVTLDPLFRAITWLGDSSVYLALVPLALWQGDKARGMRIALLLLFSLYLNLLIKDAFAIPRPFVVSTAVQAKDTASSYAFPSGHAQGAATLWLGLAIIYGRRAALAVGAFLIPAVSFSRVYLGVHYPQDTIGGILLGLAVIGAYCSMEPPFGRWWRRRNVGLQVALCALGPLAMAALTRGTYAHAVSGAILGLSLGRAIEGASSGRLPPPRATPWLVRLLVGLGIVGAGFVVAMLAVTVAYTGEIAAPAPVALGQAALVGLAVSLGVPWLLGRLDEPEAAPP